jgi:hypothetical protein
MLTRILNIILIITTTAVSYAFAQQTIRYDDFVYDNNIKSVKFSRPEFDFSMPILELNTDQVLILSFDDLRGDYRNYRYTIELCDAWWQPVDLPQADYISGFFENDIVDYRYSGNTRLPYVHYSLTFPDENLKPTKSGNYILKVWSNDSGENVIAFTKRFFVLDSRVAVAGTITAGTLIDSRWYKQEVDFQLDRLQMNLVNPYENLKVVVLQNGKWSNGLFQLKPKIIKGNILDYDLEIVNAFDGGNEFRNFDIKSMKYRTSDVDGIQLIDGQYHVFLTPDVKRNFLQYSHKSDINGRYYIKTDDDDDSDVDADYVYVYFTLLSDAPRTDGDIYLYGELTNRQLTDDYKMKYSFERKAYESMLLLKQGFYDYEYVFVPQGQVIPDAAEIEGRHFATENEYSIWVYYRPPGEMYDQLVGIQFLTTRN